MKLPHAVLITCLGAAPLWAQQVEQKTEVQKPAAAGNAGASSSGTATISANGVVTTDSQNSTARSDHGHSRGHDRSKPQPEQKAVAYIGLLTREVPPELRAQFSLPEGFGLLVDEVMPDSPAKSAGLKLYDVLVKFEDQQLVNMEQFMSLVRAKKKGEVVQLGVITGGKETKVAVTLGERMVAAHKEHQSHYHGGYTGRTQPNTLPHGQMFLNEQPRGEQPRGEQPRGEQPRGEQPRGEQPRGEQPRGEQPRGFQNQGNALQEQMERFQKEMREYVQRMLERAKSGGNAGPKPEMPQPPIGVMPGHSQQRGERHNSDRRQPQTGISIPPGTNLQQFNFSQSNATTNVTRRDDSGEYSIKGEDGKKTFTARPNNGQEKSWPVNTDAERQAVPQEFRDKLNMMDGANSGIRIEINPGPGSAPPAPPPVKGKTTSA